MDKNKILWTSSSVALIAVVLAVLLMPRDTACLPCEQLIKSEMGKLRGGIEEAGRAAVGHAADIALNVSECANGLIIIEQEPCEDTCPEHPERCWLLAVRASCDQRVFEECIDVPGDMDILSAGTYYGNATVIRIERTDENTIRISNAIP